MGIRLLKYEKHISPAVVEEKGMKNIGLYGGKAGQLNDN